MNYQLLPPTAHICNFSPKIARPQITDILSPGDFDPLRWWGQRVQKYPLLSQADIRNSSLVCWMWDISALWTLVISSQSNATRCTRRPSKPFPLFSKATKTNFVDIDRDIVETNWLSDVLCTHRHDDSSDRLSVIEHWEQYWVLI